MNSYPKFWNPKTTLIFFLNLKTPRCGCGSWVVGEYFNFVLFWCAFLIDDNTTLTSHFFFIENSGDFALFKNHLDIFLSRVPDQPTIPGMARAAMSNSSLNQVPLVPNLDQFYCMTCMHHFITFILFCLPDNHC